MKNFKIFTSAFLFFIVISQFGYAQNNIFKGDPDEAFKTARELAFDGKRSEAQDSLLLILTKYPNYHDVRIFLASTYAWDGKYAIAEENYTYVINLEENNKEAWLGLIKTELWAEKPFKALELTNKALEFFGDDEEIIYLKAKAQENTNKPEEAYKTVTELLKKNSTNEGAIELKEKLNQTLSYNSIGLTATLETYSKTFDPMQYYALNYGRQTKYGSIIAKINLSRRFGENGVQYEVDLYPKITKGLYAYLNFGIANSFLYPDTRYGAEVYKSLPKSFEISVGFRALKYDETTTIYTGSLGWYTGNSYLSFRPYIIPGDSGTSMSGNLEYRKYGKSADNYFSVTAGVGFSPEIYRFEVNNNEDEIVQLESQKLNVAYYFTSKNNKNKWGSKLGVTHQEISFYPGNYFWITTLGISWEIKFK